MSSLVAGSIALPLDDEQLRRVQQATEGLSPAQLQWLSGYVAGIAAQTDAPLATAAATDRKTLAVLYGSQTGNGRAIAEALGAAAREQGFGVRVESLAHYKPASLRRETLATFVISTHGEGEPPDDAELFHEFLLSPRAPRLQDLRYSVLALGDSSYVNFCQTGREFDARLAELGASRVVPLVECDVDYEDVAADWSRQVIDRLPDLLEAAGSAPRLRAVPSRKLHDRRNPFPAEVLLNQRITGSGSDKAVHHIELSLAGSGLSYEPGDALAVVTENPPQLVEELVELLGGTNPLVSVGGEEIPFADAMRQKLEITAPSLGFLKAWARQSASAELAGLLEPEARDRLTAFVETHQVVDIVRRYPAEVDAAGFAAALRKLPARSYSIASSPLAYPDEVHLTVAAVHYSAFGREHWGSASTHLVERLAAGDTLPVYVESNPRFRLPADDVPVIMIGPGTGVAPFRAFVEERVERGASGRNWLFFGDRRFSSDFLYQLEWLRHLKQGHLERLDVAFSRDQADKVYVQHRLAERGADVYRWLQDGASVYVCGDAKRMAGDVDAALAGIVSRHGNRSAEGAEDYVKELRRAGRYQRDVY